ncbi:YolD-like family protein [Lentibacillus sp. Marseille-P4043]|uniref:YolD-like family protein n=1 Tax=Lentibacillus sp. Marseille-P4043 TaxID=2040293 RepID=UPI000D0BAF6D|nr:YolD-like family protein [Lentibacillus sp. Marseille-P4043]
MNPNKLTPGRNLMWESSRMMLPEHKARIRQHQKELTKRTKPILDEQQIELFSGMISDAMQQGLDLRIQIFHPYQDHYVTGKVQKITPEQKLKLVTLDGSEWVSFDEIMDVSVC